MKEFIITCICAIVTLSSLFAQDSWKTTQQNGKGMIKVYHASAPPFISKVDSRTQGVEVDLFTEFSKFIKNEYQIDLKIQYVQMSGFREMYNAVKVSPTGIFGASSLSITPKRQEEVNFSPPYMPDIQVLASSINIPVVNSVEEFQKVFKDLTAVTLANSSPEQHLNNLRKYIPDFPMEYVQKSAEVYNQVAEQKDKFAYVQLDSYFLALEKGLNMNRQNLFKIEEMGRAWIFSKSSDWNEPVDAFFKQAGFKPLANQIIQKYFGDDVNDLIWELADTSRTDRNKDVLMLTKEKEMQSLELEKNRLEAQRQAMFRNFLLIGFAVVIIFSVLLLNRYQIKQRNNALLLQKNEELRQQSEEILSQRDFIEKKNNELDQRNSQIYNSIKAALVIQKAMLPYEERMQVILREFFVLYHPKDIVSGDFYWLQKVRNKTFIAVADCTGHGVPGALMAMLGQALLDKIVLLGNEEDPAKIIHRMHNEIQFSLKQEDIRNNFGMDICFISIEESTDNQVSICFSGAKRPLYYIKPGTKEILELKGDRKSLGGWQNDVESFTHQEILLPKGTLLYLSSDGFVDQNNISRKRFSEKRLKKLLIESASLPLENQKEILEVQLQEQMRGTNQRDDILIVGLKL